MNDFKKLQIELRKEIVRIEDTFRSRYPHAVAQTMTGLLMFGPSEVQGTFQDLEGDARFRIRHRSDQSKRWTVLADALLADQIRAVYWIGELDALLAKSYEKLNQDLQGSVEFIKRIHPA